MDILLLALLAIFLLAKLFSVLGNDSNPPSQLKRGENNGEPKRDAVIDVDFKKKSVTSRQNAPQASAINEPVITDPDVLGRIEEIRAKDSNFTAGSFLSGASMAYEMVVSAFNKADSDTLKGLLSAKVYDLFYREIKQAQSKGEYPETTIIAIKDSTIEKIEVIRNKARIFVKFVAEEVNVLKDKDGNIVEGDPSSIEEIADEWVFERDLRSTNPNWTIVAT